MSDENKTFKTDVGAEMAKQFESLQECLDDNFRMLREAISDAADQICRVVNR